MKIERKEKAFEPVTITFESLEELKAFVAVGGCDRSVYEAIERNDYTLGLSMETFRHIVSKIYTKFKDEVE